MKAITAAKLSKMGIGFALAYLTYKLVSSVDVSGHLIKAFKRKTKEEQSTQIKSQQQEIKQELKQLTELQELLAYKCANFEVETISGNEGVLSKRCLLSFFAETFDVLDQKQIISINVESRKARRQVFPDLQNKFVCTLDQSIKYLIDKAQKDFALFLNLDYRKVMDSISYHIDNEEEQEAAEEFRIHIVEIMSTMRENLANYMPLFHSPISKSLLSEIVTFQTQTLHEQRDQLIEMARKMGLETKEEEEALPLFVTCFLEDSIWNHYQIESEQMSVESEDMDEQLRTKFQQFKRLREEVIKDMHFSIQDNLILNKS